MKSIELAMLCIRMRSALITKILLSILSPYLLKHFFFQNRISGLTEFINTVDVIVQPINANYNNYKVNSSTCSKNKCYQRTSMLLDRSLQIFLYKNVRFLKSYEMMNYPYKDMSVICLHSISVIKLRELWNVCNVHMKFIVCGTVI